MSDALRVQPEVLEGLAGRAGGLAGEVGALAAGMPDAPVSVVGHPSLTAALEAFASSWVRRGAALEDELHDAAEFLRTFADSLVQVDREIADSADG